MRKSLFPYNSHLVILAADVRAEEAVLVLGDLGGNLGPLRGGEVLGHPCIEGEYAGGGAKLSAHVANRSHTLNSHDHKMRYEGDLLFW